MKRSFASFALVTALATTMLSGCIISTDDDSTLTVDNLSDYAIYELYLTEEDNPSWGPNLLGSQPLFPGEIIVIDDIDCDFYDALLVDEDGVECELLSVDLCFDDAVWEIRNNTCSIFAAEGDKDVKDAGAAAN